MNTGGVGGGSCLYGGIEVWGELVLLIFGVSVFSIRDVKVRRLSFSL